MRTEVIDAFAPGALERAAQILAEGGLVAFATETVYGLGADARSAEAVAKIFAAKGRPASNPLIAHVLDVAMARRCVSGWDERCDALAARFWPGPLTIVLSRRPWISAAVSAAGATLAVRAPAHPVARELIERFGAPIAAPSANRSESISPTTAEHVRLELDGRIPLILDGGPCNVGIESTVVDMTGAKPRILRPGQVSREDIARVVGSAVDVGPGPGAPRSPGQRRRHYAPRTPCHLFTRGTPIPTDAAVIAWGDSMDHQPSRVLAGDPFGYARELYAALRWADAQGCAEIWIERPGDGTAWRAVHDRVQRACETP